MIPDAGSFDANTVVEAVRLFDTVLSTPGAWCNLQFEPIEDEDAIPESPMFQFLAARGPANPLATIMARTDSKRPKPAQVGIQHQAGTKAAAQLREADLLLPDGARVAQDHPRRGLVVEWPDAETTATLQRWLFPAMRVLSRHDSTNIVLYSVSVTQ